MTDQFLLSHQVGGGIFSLSGAHTLSIRDQMLRAQLLVKRCILLGLIDDIERHLLVVGGGVAGAVAAMTAAEAGVKVMLVEKRNDLFGKQKKCFRYLNPTEYDWPAPHWDRAIYTWCDPQAPLKWSEGVSDIIAHGWDIDFSRWLLDPNIQSRVMIERGITVKKDDIKVRDEDPTVVIYNHPNKKQLIFGAVISCVGQGTENCSVLPSYRGYSFWGDDPYRLPNLGLSPDIQPKVLISGGGDGALQDYIRLTTGYNATKLYKFISSNIPPEVNENVMSLCIHADDKARRAWTWSPSKQGTLGTLAWEHAVLQNWHDVYKQAADIIWNNLGRDTKNKLSQNVADRAKVVLIHPCNHFDYSYGLNRILVLILDKLIRENGRISIFPERKLIKVEPKPKVVCKCKLSPSSFNCHGQLHYAWTENHTCLNPAPDRNNDDEKLKYIDKLSTNDKFGDAFHAIIVRHGVKQSPLFGHLLYPRQIVPFHLPGL